MGSLSCSVVLGFKNLQQMLMTEKYCFLSLVSEIIENVAIHRMCLISDMVGGLFIQPLVFWELHLIDITEILTLWCWLSCYHPDLQRKALWFLCQLFSLLLSCLSFIQLQLVLNDKYSQWYSIHAQACWGSILSATIFFFLSLSFPWTPWAYFWT